MGYFSRLDVRVKELGHKPGTKEYDAAALRQMKDDCKEHRGVLACYYCRAHSTCTILREQCPPLKKERRMDVHEGVEIEGRRLP